MQFHSNADYPADGVAARDPLDFPAAQPRACARITTRVQRRNGEITMVDNVLVRAAPSASNNRRPSVNDLQNMDFDSLMELEVSSSSSSSSGGDISDLDADAEDTMDEDNHNHAQQQQQAEADDIAYWIQRTVREAIYGRVLLAVILKKAPSENVWRVSNQQCAVKELEWQHIRRERDRLAEDPVKEVSAMQYFQEWLGRSRKQTTTNNSTAASTTAAAAAAAADNTGKAKGSTEDGDDDDNDDDPVTASFRDMLATNVMMPLDLLSDERYLYSIMPFCNGGELFELLDMNERFTEAEARYWMQHVLNGLESLQHAGICHRDMSLENLLVHESGALIIDMGMCLRLPYPDEQQQPQEQQQPSPLQMNLSASFADLNMNGGGDGSTTATAAATAATTNGDNDNNTLAIATSKRGRPRYFVTPQGTCGKWNYMSPEIYRNQPFDGHAVDLWAAGVILFLMLTGFPPWDRASQTDERFRYMTAGYLVQMLTEWEIPISPDAMDLLQRMLFLDPKDRLGLDQVRAHPWMVNGPVEPPMR